MAMSEFGKAFASARKAGDKTFMFKGKEYTTESREEKADRMATNQRQKMAGSAAGAGRGASAGRQAEDKPRAAAPEKKMPEAKSSGRGMMAGRRAEDKPRAVAAQPERKPIRMEGLERAKKGISGMMASRQRRLDMEEADRMSRGDKYGMGMKKGGKVKKSRDGMASKGKTKGRMC
jgi:hypothetical protein